MAEDIAGTKLAIIEAAGRLFADHGADAVGIRTIAEKAGVNAASINYHFGSKEKLYVEIFRHLFQQSGKAHIPRMIDALGDAPSADDIAGAIRDVVKARFGPLIKEDRPEWHERFVIRSMLRSLEPLRPVIEEHFAPEHNAIKRLVQLARPGLSDAQATMMTISLLGQSVIYFVGREMIPVVSGDTQFDRQYFETAVEDIAGLYITALGLSRGDRRRSNRRKRTRTESGRS